MQAADHLTQTPFVLLDDARAQDAADARLYRAPVEIVTAHDAAGLEAALARLDRAAGQGLHAAGYLAYEAGYALEHRLRTLLPPHGKPPHGKPQHVRPLCWFGLFTEYRTIAAREMPDWLAAQRRGEGTLYALQPGTGLPAYRAAYAAVQRAIGAGDIYQANLTFQLRGHYAGDPLAIYARYRARAQAGYGGVIYDGRDWQLSFSPELFFTLLDGEITARPMKGTVPRNDEVGADAAAARGLQESVKDRAENLMIVDLLRNDLSRVAEPGSVQVPELFGIESYPTVHQMTSTVRARLAAGRSVGDMLRAIFPCGSITGAPKIRAMEILAALEDAPRGVYCGAMGRIDAAQDGRQNGSAAAFNVAIRTLHLDSAAKTATMGLGSAIVADSHVDAEWAECALKGAFVTDNMQAFDLIETMAFDPVTGIARTDAHLERMKASACALGFEFDRHAARNQLHAVCFHAAHPARVRLMLAKSGAMAIAMHPMPPALPGPARVRIVPLPVDAGDIRLRHKTSDRGFYDDARHRAQGADEVIFARPDGQLTEGSFTHIFAGSADRGYATPPLHLGLLPGILRAELLDSGQAHEQGLTQADLTGGFFIGNALRGLMPAVLA